MVFSRAQTDGINDVFTAAYKAGRTVLYEHEVYRLLAVARLSIPRFQFVTHPDELDGTFIKTLGRHVMVKIVSGQIVHKERIGGVRKVRNGDIGYIQYTMHHMEKQILLSKGDKSLPDIAGFLVVEFMPHSQALGNEVFIGMKADPAFGAAVVMSKGGSDAEFFSRYYDPANLFIPPFDTAYALEMMRTLNIRHKFEANGHPEYLAYYARAMATLSQIAYHYSVVPEQKPPFVIQSMDVNPFIITEDDRFVAIDGYAEFSPYHGGDVPKVNVTNLSNFFKPSGVAIAGVSKNLSKISLGRDIAQLMHDLGRKDLCLLNPKGGHIVLGKKTYRLYRDLDEYMKMTNKSVTLLVYAAPQQYILSTMENLPREKGPHAVILIPGMPSDMDYKEFERQMDRVRPRDMRVIGPNCMGVYHAPDSRTKGVNTLFIEEARLEIRHSRFSNTLLLTQSGAFAVTVLDKFQHSCIFKAVVSFGNKYDVKLTDLMAFFAGSRQFDVLALYIEGLDEGEGRLFYQIVSQIKKPVIVYKAGRTDAGARAAQSHTASISGSYEVFRAACVQTGVILAENLEDHYHFVRIFSLLSRRKPVKDTVAGVVNAGFESTVGADELIHLKQAILSPQTVRRLNRINRFGLVNTASPFLDISPMADDRMYADFVEKILQDDNVGSVFVAIVPHTATLKTSPSLCRDEDGLAALLVNLNLKYEKPMVVSVNGGQHYSEFISILEENGIPVYKDIRSAIKSLDRFVTYHLGETNIAPQAKDRGRRKET